MRRWPLRLALVSLGGLAIMGGGGWYLASNLDLVAFEAELALAVRERIGHDLRIEGLELALLPRPALEIEGVELGAAPGFGPAPMLRIQRVSAPLRLVPLLRGELALGVLRLEGLELELARSEAGRGSWETLGQHLARGGVGERSLPEFRALRLSEGRVRFVDHSTGRSLEAAIPQLLFVPADGDELGRLEVEADAGIADPAVALGLSFRGSGQLDEGSLRMADFRVELDLEGEGVPGGGMPLSIEGRGTLALGSGSFSSPALLLRAPALELTGSLEGAVGAEGLVLTGNIEAHSAEPRALLASLGRPLELAAPEALSRASVKGGYRLEGGQLRIDGAVLEVDDTRATGALVVAGMSPPELWFTLDIGALDLGRYGLNPGADGETIPELPTAWVRGEIAIERLRHGQLELSALRLPLRLEGRALYVEGVQASLLGGSLQANLALDRRQPEGTMRASGSLEGLDLAQALAAAGASGDASGRVDLRFDLAGRGEALEAIEASLDGLLCVSLQDGILPLARRAPQAPIDGGGPGARARLLDHRLGMIRDRVEAKVRERTETLRPDHLDVRHLGACFEIEQGVAHSDDLRLLAQQLQLEGVGSIDLPAGQLDLSCSLMLEDLPPMSLRLHGALDDPEVALDKPEALELARYRAEQRRAELQAQLERQRSSLQGGLEQRREDLREGLREKAAPGLDKILDHREQTIERRDELRQQVQEARQGLRDQARGARDELRALRKGEAEQDEGAPTEPEEDGAL
jgi:AsmA protein